MNATHQYGTHENVSVLSDTEQNRLKQSRVAFAGTGGAGNIQIELLARAGIGEWNITESVLEILQNIDENIKTTSFQDGISESNVHGFFKGVDILVDSLDCTRLPEKILLHKKARELELYAVVSSASGFGASLMIFDPQGMTFEEFIGYNPDNSIEENIQNYIYAITPAISGGVNTISPSIGVSAALVVTEVINILTGKNRSIIAPKALQIDLLKRQFYHIDSSHKNSDRRKIWDNFGSSGAYDSFRNTDIYQEMIQKSVSMLSHCPSVLDMGCGTGNLTQALCRKNISVWSFDYSPQMVHLTEKKVLELENEYKQNSMIINRQDVTSVKYPDSSFDGAAMLNVLFNLEEPDKAIREAYRILKNQGTLVISGPLNTLDESNFRDVGEQLKLEAVSKAELHDKNEIEGLVEKARIYNLEMAQKGYIGFRPTESELQNLLSKSGFRIEKFDKIYLGQSFLVTAKKME